jgi:23S rRNA pseudouridine2605 synthase
MSGDAHPGTIRLQKALADRGVASRRGAADLIRRGRVTVDGIVTREPGLRVDPGRQTVAVDGITLSQAPEPHRTILLHKPRGLICSRSDVDGRTVYGLLPDELHSLVPAGRLDRNSEGLLVMSNDGDLVARLTHPRFGHGKTYRVTVSGTVDAATLARLQEPFMVDGHRTRPARVVVLKPAEAAGRLILEFTLREGRKRQVREMCAGVGLRVHRLVRTGEAGLTLRGLAPGEWRELTREECLRVLRG